MIMIQTDVGGLDSEVIYTLAKRRKKGNRVFSLFSSLLVSYFDLVATGRLYQHLSIGFAFIQVQGQMKIEAKLQADSGIL